MIHQVFLLTRGWWKRSAFTKIIPSLNWGIFEYYPNNIPQFSNLTLTLSDERAFLFFGCYRRRKENIFLFINSYQRTLKKKTSPVEKSELFVNNFSIALQNIWRIWNTIASTLCKNILVHLPTDTICSSKLTSSVSSIYFVPWIFPWMFFKELVDIDEKYLFLTINGKSKTKKWEIWFPIFNFPFHFPIPHSLLLLLVTSRIENKISSPWLHRFYDWFPLVTKWPWKNCNWDVPLSVTCELCFAVLWLKFALVVCWPLRPVVLTCTPHLPG